MFTELWTFLRDPSNQTLLSWIGGGAVVACGGVWAAFKFFVASKPASPTQPSSSTADHGSVVIGHDNKDSPIHINKPK